MHITSVRGRGGAHLKPQNTSIPLWEGRTSSDGHNHPPNTPGRPGLPQRCEVRPDRLQLLLLYTGLQHQQQVLQPVRLREADILDGQAPAADPYQVAARARACGRGVAHVCQREGHAEEVAWLRCGPALARHGQRPAMSCEL